MKSSRTSFEKRKDEARKNRRNINFFKKQPLLTDPLILKRFQNFISIFNNYISFKDIFVYKGSYLLGV